MDWKAKTGTDVLNGIIMLLLALAALADRAAASPCKTRRRVLGILHRAEAVANASLFDVARELGAPIFPQPTSVASPIVGDTPSDATVTALLLRAIALVWLGLLTWLRRVVCRQAREGFHETAAALLRKVADTLPVRAFARPPIDTS